MALVTYRGKMPTPRRGQGTPPPPEMPPELPFNAPTTEYNGPDMGQSRPINPTVGFDNRVNDDTWGGQFSWTQPKGPSATINQSLFNFSQGRRQGANRSQGRPAAPPTPDRFNFLPQPAGDQTLTPMSHIGGNMQDYWQMQQAQKGFVPRWRDPYPPPQAPPNPWEVAPPIGDYPAPYPPSQQAPNLSPQTYQNQWGALPPRAYIWPPGMAYGFSDMSKGGPFTSDLAYRSQAPTLPWWTGMVKGG